MTTLNISSVKEITVFSCNSCCVPCNIVIEQPTYEVFRPTVCPYGQENPNWEEEEEGNDETCHTCNWYGYAGNNSKCNNRDSEFFDQECGKEHTCCNYETPPF